MATAPTPNSPSQTSAGPSAASRCRGAGADWLPRVRETAVEVEEWPVTRPGQVVGEAA